jgi:hypothetical protein
LAEQVSAVTVAERVRLAANVERVTNRCGSDEREGLLAQAAEITDRRRGVELPSLFVELFEQPSRTLISTTLARECNSEAVHHHANDVGNWPALSASCMLNQLFRHK